MKWLGKTIFFKVSSHKGFKQVKSLLGVTLKTQYPDAIPIFCLLLPVLTKIDAATFEVNMTNHSQDKQRSFNNNWGTTQTHFIAQYIFGKEILLIL